MPASSRCAVSPSGGRWAELRRHLAACGARNRQSTCWRWGNGSTVLVCGGWALRIRLGHETTVKAAKELTAMSAKALRCRFGRHHWIATTNPDGDPYDRCQRCGKDRVTGMKGATGGVMGMTQQAIRGFVKKRK